jgi:putative transposase
MAISFKGAPFSVGYRSDGRTLVSGVSLERSPCGRTPGRAWGTGRPRHHPALGRQIQSATGRGVPRRKRAVGVSWSMDETYIKGKGQWRYLYRAVDKQGHTIDFLLTEQRDEHAAKRFLTKAIRRHGVPEKITIDGSAANEAAIKNYNAAHGTAIIIRQVKYLNNVVEQDHRAVKRVTRPMLGFKVFEAAQATLVGIELMHMIKKWQLMVEASEEGLTAAELFYSLAA